MKVSLATIQRLVNFELPSTADLVKRLGEQLGGVESIIELAPKYRGAVIVQVMHAEKHPNADKLTVCLIDDSDAVKDVERDGEGYVTVVCGAPNVREGMFAVWLPPNTTVPASVDTREPFVLNKRELRGVISNGMLAAADELGIGTNHDGIVDLTEHDLPPHVEARALRPGQDFAELFELDDTIIDIENKMFTHRPDCFGQLGVAREIAGIFGESFDDPKWYYERDESDPTAQAIQLDVFNDCGDTVPRFMAVPMDNVTIADSPFWLKAKLVALGSKPINNVVDVTNFVMLMTAQPLHAYDYDKLHGARIGARYAIDNEKVTLLNGKTYELSSDDIVIADGAGVVGLGGVMGGGESEVSASTTRIVLECASFDMYTVRKTSMRHGLFTDAVTRFNKGQSMLMNPYVMQYCMRLLGDLSGAKQAGDAHDDLMDSKNEWRTNPPVRPMLEPREIDTRFINERLGLALSVDEMMTMLTHVGFECEEKSDGRFSYWAPAWRMDIQDKEDVVEEIGRLYGFGKLPLELPTRSISPAPRNHSRVVAEKVRLALMRMGANEVLTYSFVHENVLVRAGQDIDKAYKLSNALSPQLQYYRVSLLPSLLDKVHPNIKAGYDEFCIFEIGKAHIKDDLDDHGLPKEYRRIAGAYALKQPGDISAAYFTARQFVEQLCVDFRLKSRVSFVPVAEFDSQGSQAFEQMLRPFDRDRSSVFIVQGKPGGIVGELTRSATKKFKLPERCAAFELFPSVFENTGAIDKYVPLSKYPGITQDISLRGDATVPYGKLLQSVESVVQNDNPDGLHVDITPVSIYVGDDANIKTTTFHLTFTSHDKTLTDSDVAPLVAAIGQQAKNEFGLSIV